LKIIGHGNPDNNLESPYINIHHTAFRFLYQDCFEVKHGNSYVQETPAQVVTLNHTTRMKEKLPNVPGDNVLETKRKSRQTARVTTIYTHVYTYSQGSFEQSCSRCLVIKYLV
jgi:hypothetical protein